MEQLRREVESIFEESGWATLTRPRFRYSFLPGHAARGYPLLNISEDEENLYVEGLAPGLNPDSLSLNITHGRLSVSGEKPSVDESIETESFHRHERAAGRFTRVISLPSEVERDKSRAEYKDGILRITLPRAEAAKPKKIAVNVG
jgi:HSP20 family protein